MKTKKEIQRKRTGIKYLWVSLYLWKKDNYGAVPLKGKQIEVSTNYTFETKEYFIHGNQKKGKYKNAKNPKGIVWQQNWIFEVRWERWER